MRGGISAARPARALVYNVGGTESTLDTVVRLLFILTITSNGPTRLAIGPEFTCIGTLHLNSPLPPVARDTELVCNHLRSLDLPI